MITVVISSVTNVRVSVKKGKREEIKVCEVTSKEIYRRPSPEANVRTFSRQSQQDVLYKYNALKSTTEDTNRFDESTPL